jgi:hypothetical protein
MLVPSAPRAHTERPFPSRPEPGRPVIPIPRGPVFFERGASRRRRRLALGFTLWFLVVLAALLWPIHPIAARIEPYVLGLPFGFFWVVLWLLLSFAGLVLLYALRYGGED